MHLVDLPLHGLVEEPHERPNLGSRTRPVLRRERVDREHLHPELFATLQHPLDGPHARTMAEAGRMSAAPGPPPVAVHDDPDVPRYRRVQALQGYAGLPTPARLAARACETSPHGGEVNGSLDLHHFGFFAT